MPPKRKSTPKPKRPVIIQPVTGPMKIHFLSDGTIAERIEKPGLHDGLLWYKYTYSPHKQSVKVGLEVGLDPAYINRLLSFELVRLEYALFNPLS